MTYTAIMGYGIVGRGVAEVLDSDRERINQHIGDGIEVKYILDLLDFKGDKFERLIVHDFERILNDPDISVVVETMGGLRVAYDYTSRLLKTGKSVVTSNKELVATHGDELLALAAEMGVRYMFEASVGGGIPIIAPLEDSLAANDITEIVGVINGTSNYILSAMKSDCTFDEALKEAQENGFAERDPSDDINGKDSCRKIAILAAMVFGTLFDTAVIPTRGITTITPEIIAAAENDGCSVKLLARAVKLGSGKISLEVAPFKVKKSHPLAHIENVFNAIMVSGNNVGDVMFYGRGAGSLPTASAVVSDIIHIALHGNNQHIERLWRREPQLFACASEDADDLARVAERIGERL